jgi:DNA-directed RNA polymerase subunit RPC12/RpoP
MKILKKGKPKRRRDLPEYPKTCSNCNCEFAWQDTDTYLLDSADKAEAIRCPQCGQEIRITFWDRGVILCRGCM